MNYVSSFVISILLAFPLMTAPYTEGIDVFFESDITNSSFTVKLGKYSSTSNKGYIEDSARLQTARRVDRKKFDRLEFTMPEESGRSEIHDVQLIFEVKRSNILIGSCSFDFQVILSWAGRTSRQVRINHNKQSASGQVTCQAVPATEQENKIVFKVNKETSQNAPQKDIKFSLLTYNVQMRPVLDPNTYKAPLISARFNPYDIVGVQENFANVEGLMSKLAHPFKFHLSEKRTFTALTNSGLAIFSKYRILETKHEFYRSVASCCAGDSAASKGIIMVRLDLSGAIVDVYNTHMHAGDTLKEHEARVDQATQLVNFIKANSPPSNSVILMGDFNMSPRRNVKTRGELQPNHHYSSDEDMNRRTGTFQSMIDRLGLTDAIDTVKQTNQDFLDCKIKYQAITKTGLPTTGDARCQIMRDEIDRILYRSGTRHNLKLLNIKKDSYQFLGPDGNELSDGNPNVVTFEVHTN